LRAVAHNDQTRLRECLQDLSKGIEEQLQRLRRTKHGDRADDRRVGTEPELAAKVPWHVGPLNIRTRYDHDLVGGESGEGDHLLTVRRSPGDEGADGGPDDVAVEPAPKRLTGERPGVLVGDDRIDAC